MKMRFLFLKLKLTHGDDVLKKCEFDKVRLEAMFPTRHTPKKRVHISHATHAHTHYTTHAHSHQAQYAHTHHAKHAAHSMLMFHIHIMYLCMVEFIVAPIVAERITYLSFILIE